MATARLEETAAGVAIALAGVFFAALSWRLPPSLDPAAPGPAMAPGVLGLMLVALGTAIAATALLKRPATVSSHVEDAAEAEPGGTGKIAISAVLLLGCVVAFEPAGFIPSTFVFLLAGFRLLGGATWRFAAIASALTVAGLWLFFTRLLGVGLPSGILGEIFFR